jgi:hypothetical protein
LDREPLYLLAILQILGVEDLATGFERGSNHQRVVDVVSIFAGKPDRQIVSPESQWDG